MEELAIKRWLGVLTPLLDDPTDPMCGQPLGYTEAVGKMLGLLGGLNMAIDAHGLDSNEVMAFVVSYGGLALNACLTARGATTEGGRLEASRVLARQIADAQPSVTYMVHNGWCHLQAQIGPAYQLVNELLGAKAAVDRAGSAAASYDDTLDAYMRVLVELALIWLHRVEVRRGAALDANIPLGPDHLGEIVPFERPSGEAAAEAAGDGELGENSAAPIA